MCHRIWIFGTLAAAGLMAETPVARVGTPLVGYVQDAKSRAVRPVYGIPGASLVGEPLGLPFAVDRLAVSPRQDYLIAADNDDGGIWVVIPRDSGIETRLLADLPAGAEIFLSPAGTAAVFRGTAEMQVYTGMPDGKLARRISSGLLDSSGPLAVTDDGALVLAAGSSGLRLADASGQILPVAGDGSVSALAFRIGSHEAIVAWGDRLEWWTDPAVTAAARRQWSVRGTVVGAAFAAGGSHIFYATADGTVFDLDTVSEAFSQRSCGCTPTGFSPLQDSSIFRLTALDSGPMQLAVAEREGLQIYFVPALVEGGR